ncbi:MAG: iron-containing alcohol dehydrogenase [Candidatus Bathyarchaeia archaeon]
MGSPTGIEGYEPLLSISSFQTVRRGLFFGLNSVNRVEQEAKELAGEGAKLLLVTDKGVRGAGAVDRVLSGLKGFEVDVFDEVEAEPSIECAERAAAIAREGGYKAVVGVGGGSSLDMAKIASVMATNPGKVADYLGKGKLKRYGLPMILIPTTAGTGSETSPNIVMVVGKAKGWISDPHALPDVSIVDPMLTLTMPPKLTAGTGLDALTHAVECIMSLNSSPLDEAINLAAAEMIGRHLRTAYSNGRDLRARYHMSLAAAMAGMALGTAGVVYGHSIGYTISTRYRLPHGIACGLALPYVMEFNAIACPEKLARVAKAMGVDIGRLSLIEAALEGAKAVKALMEDVELPTSLAEIGVPKGDLPELAAEALEKYPRPNNPRQLTKEGALKLYERIWEGRLGD